MLKKVVVSVVALTSSALILSGCSLSSPSGQPANMNKPAIEDKLPASTMPQSSPSTSTDTSKTYTLSEVAAHKSASDCWTVVDGSVYNVTDFVSNHPGGAAILKACGKDGTSMITGEREHKENMANVEAALMSMKIGTLAK